MKKKGRLFLNISLLALSLCIMVAGVYAAKQATLTVSGSIGFTAHNAVIKVGAVTVANALKADATTYDTALAGYSDASHVALPEAINFTNAMYFDDISGSTATVDNIKPIVIKVRLYNYSRFATVVDAKTAENAVEGNENIKYTVAVSYDTTGATSMAASTNGTTAGGSCTVTFTMTYSATTTEITTPVRFTLNANIKKAAA